MTPYTITLIDYCQLQNSSHVLDKATLGEWFDLVVFVNEINMN